MTAVSKPGFLLSFLAGEFFRRFWRLTAFSGEFFPANFSIKYKNPANFSGWRGSASQFSAYQRCNDVEEESLIHCYSWTHTG
jgi:hypothetical protein